MIVLEGQGEGRRGLHRVQQQIRHRRRVALLRETWDERKCALVALC